MFKYSTKIKKVRQQDSKPHRNPQQAPLIESRNQIPFITVTCYMMRI